LDELFAKFWLESFICFIDSSTAFSLSSIPIKFLLMKEISLRTFSNSEWQKIINEINNQVQNLYILSYCH
jgi:hypothetical protein